ncbi:MAG: PspC domain-containing protein [Saprospiraceae bacterium]|nr:PspC domain-containing protein [Saprospiraceae bacterium]
MDLLIAKAKAFFEVKFFGVCAYIGEKFNIPSRYIRFNFVYVSLLTFGSPVIIYLVLAFWLNVKAKIKRRTSVWDL